MSKKKCSCLEPFCTQMNAPTAIYQPYIGTEYLGKILALLAGGGIVWIFNGTGFPKNSV